MSNETIFDKIVRGEAPAEIYYQDELVTAFRDIYGQAPVHILIVTNKPIATLNDVAQEDEPALGRLLTVAAKLAREHGIAEEGYRVLLNCGHNGGQTVYHLHMHLVGGRHLGPLLPRA